MPNTKLEKTKKFIDKLLDPYKKDPLCDKYRLGDPIKERSFNNKYNKEEYRYLWKPENDYTEPFDKMISFRIKNGNNFFINVSGEPMLGKSVIGQTIGQKILAAFTEYLKITPIKHTVFDDNKLFKIFPIVDYGDLLIKDEPSHTQGKGSGNLRKQIANILDIVRKNQNCFIFIAPERMEMDIITYYIEAAGKCKKDKTNRCFLYDPTSEKWKDKKKPVGVIYFTIPDEILNEKDYEKRKDINIKTTLKHRGVKSLEIDGEALKKDTTDFFEWCKKKKIKKKNLFKSEIVLYNNQFNDDNEYKRIIDIHPNYIDDMVFNQVWAKLENHWEQKEKERKEREKQREEEKKQKEAEEQEKKRKEILNTIGVDLSKFDYQYDEEKVFARVIEETKMKNPKRDIEFIKLRERGKTLEEIGAIHGLDYSSVSTQINKMEGEIYRLKGKILEEKFADYLDGLGIFRKVIVNGAKGESDVIAIKGYNTVYVFSLKNKKFDKKHPYIYVKDYYPELKFAREQKERNGKEVYAYVIAFNNLNNETQIHEMDLINPGVINIFSS